MILWACKQLLLWGGLAAVVYLGIGYRAALFPPGDRQAAAPAPAVAQGAPEPAHNPVATNNLVYHADKRGHVFLEAVVNGAPVHFLVDTGASFVALSPRDAAAAGISRSQLDFNASATTASGHVRVAPVKLREVRLGQLSVGDVPAAVVENLDISLLGQSFLKRLQSYEMRDGVLTITW